MCGNGDVRDDVEFIRAPLDDVTTGADRDFVLRSVGPAQLLDVGLDKEVALDRWYGPKAGRKRLEKDAEPPLALELVSEVFIVVSMAVETVQLKGDD